MHCASNIIRSKPPSPAYQTRGPPCIAKYTVRGVHSFCVMSQCFRPSACHRWLRPRYPLPFAAGLRSGSASPIGHRYGRAESSPASGAPSAGLGGGDGFVIDHENAGLNKPLIVFVANDLIPNSTNVSIEGRASRIKAFSVLLAYDP